MHHSPHQGFGRKGRGSCGNLGRSFTAPTKVGKDHGHTSLVRAIRVAEVAHEVAFLDEGGDGHVERQGCRQRARWPSVMVGVAQNANAQPT